MCPIQKAKRIIQKVENRTKKESILLHISEFYGITNNQISVNSGIKHNLVKKYTHHLYSIGKLDRFKCSGQLFYKSRLKFN